MRLFLLVFSFVFLIQSFVFAEDKSLKKNLFLLNEDVKDKKEEKNKKITNDLHLIVTITMPSGKLETFGSEIKKLEIISHEDGEIDMIHLVLGNKKNGGTHVWYNYDLISKLSYKFITKRGREMVYVKILQPSPLNKELKTPLNPLDPMEYR